MTVRNSALALAALCVGSLSSVAGQAQAPGSPATKFQHISQSLEALLNSGYEIRDNMGMGSFIILAKRDGGTMRWATCTMNIKNGMMSDPTKMQTTTSTCFAFN